MTYFITLPAITPPARSDDLVWSQVAFLEADAEIGPFAQFDIQALSPLDSTPSNPMTRTLTSTRAELPNGWYKLQFYDVNNGTWTSAAVQQEKPSAFLTTDGGDPRENPDGPLNWFTLDDLQAAYPNYTRVQAANEDWVNNILVPNAVRFILGRVLWSYPTERADDLKQVAMSYVANRILADDETIAMMRARGQSSITVAGQTLTLDLSDGRNFWLTAEDEATLADIRGEDLSYLHVDKIATRGDGPALYTQPRGRDSVDYIRDDYSGRPWYAGY